MTGIPHHHAICAIHHIDKNPEDYVHNFYKKEKYRQTYVHMMGGLNIKKFWSKKEFDPRQPPLGRRMPEMLAKNRRKEENELNMHKMSRKERNMICHLCYQAGHNKHICLLAKKKKASQNSSHQEDSRIESNTLSTPIPSVQSR